MMNVEELYKKVKTITECKVRKRNGKINREDTEDMVQETFIRVCKQLDMNYDPSKSSVNTYINIIITGTVCNLLQKKSKLDQREILVEGCEDGDSLVEVGELDCNISLKESLYDIKVHSNLSKKELDIIKMRTRGYKLQEIGKSYNVSKNRIHKIISDISNKLPYILNN